MCWECYSCVKICPTQAIEVRGYADFVPMGATRRRRCARTDNIMWTVKFRNGTLKRFKFPIRTTPEGKAEPAGGCANEPTTSTAPRSVHRARVAGPGRSLDQVSEVRSEQWQNFETVEVETDLLIFGGGMAACGAAVEAAYWAKKNGLKVTLVDKAAMDRSGAVAMGLSAINQYVDLKDGKNTLKDYVRLRPQRPDGRHPRGPGGQHRPPRGLHGPPVREVGPADLEGRGRQATSTRVAGS